MGRTWCFGAVMAGAAVILTGCGAVDGSTGSSDSPGGVVLVSAITGPILNTVATPVRIDGAGFATAAGSTVTVRFTAVAGTPFNGGTSATADVVGTVISDTQVDLSTPIAPGTTFSATVTVILPSTIAGTSATAIATFIGITVTACAPPIVSAHTSTPISISGNGFSPAGACTIRFRAPTGTPFLGGTSAFFDVPGTVNSLTNITGSSGVPGLAKKLNARIEVLLTGGGQGGSVGPVILFEVRPTAVADSFSGAIGNVPFSVLAASGVKANDTDPDADPISVNSVGTFVTSQGGSVTLAADGSFSYRSPLGFEGADTFTYTVSDGFLSSLPATATVNVNEVVWFIDSAAAPAGTGRFEAPFTTVAAFNAIQGLGATPAQADDFIHVFNRGATYAGSVTLLAGQRLQGTGEALVVGATTIYPATTRPLLQASSGSTVTLGAGNQIRGIEIRNTSGKGVTGTAFGTLTVRTSRVIVTNGRALDLASGTLDAQFVDVASDLSPNEGSLLNAVGGTLSISGTYSATNPITDGLRIQGASAVATTIASVTITNAIGNGIDLVGGTALFEVDGGTIDLIGKIGVQAGTPSRAGPITLKNTLVKRTGNNGVAAQESHGMRLRECTGDILVQGCTFTDMKDNDPAFFTDNSGVDLVNTTGTLANLTITQCAFNGQNLALSANTTDHGARVILEGTAKITTCAFTNNTASFLDASAMQLLMDPDDSGDSPTITNLNITDNPSIQTQGFGFELRIDGLSTLPNFHIDRNRIFGDNTSFPTLGFTASGGVLFDMGEFITGVVSTASATGTISNNDLDDLGDGQFDRGFDLLTQDNTRLTVTMNANTIDGTAAEGILLRSFDTTILTATVTSNVLAATRKVLLGSGGGAIQCTSDQTSILQVQITGNSVGIAPSTLALNPNGTSVMRIKSIAPAAPSGAQVVAFLAPLNPGTATVTATPSGSGTFGTW